MSSCAPYDAVQFLIRTLKRSLNLDGLDIRVGTVNDRHDDNEIQKTPRVLVQRGSIQGSVHLLGSGFVQETSEQKVFRQDVRGDITIVVEAIQEGTCEEIAEYIRKFLVWSRQFYEVKFGFQSFANQIMVSPCDMDGEDTEKFKITISIPYVIEEQWSVKDITPRINHIFSEIEGL